MNPPAGPYGDEEEVDYAVVAREGEPPVVKDPIPLMNQITLYFAKIKVPSEKIQELVKMKTIRRNRTNQGIISCNKDKQRELVGEVHDIAEGQSPRWIVDDDNIGRHVASGLTKQSDFVLAFTINDEEEKVGFNSSHADGA